MSQGEENEFPQRLKPASPQMPAARLKACPFKARVLNAAVRLREYLFAYALIFTFLFVTHAPLLRLPYFWDEAGYFVPAARDLLLTGSLVPHTTLSNAHPPLVMLWLAFWWKFSGFTPAVTRIAMLMVSAFALLGLWQLARDVANEQVAAATVQCTAVYSVFFAQSSLAHLDMMVCALTLWGLAMYVERRPVATLVFFALAPLAKETAIVTPLALLAWELLCPVLQGKVQGGKTLCLYRRKRLLAFSFLLCLVPLALWFLYLHHRTGFYFGNPEYLRYNLQATLSPFRILLAILVRLWHTLGYLNLFVLTLAAAYAMSLPPLQEPDGTRRPRIPISVQLVFGVVILAHVLALSALGGAVLARYMLPAVPLSNSGLCFHAVASHPPLAYGGSRLRARLSCFALLTPPPYRIAPEDTLLYRDYIILHKLAADELAVRFPHARVLTAWPATDELARARSWDTSNSHSRWCPSRTSRPWKSNGPRKLPISSMLRCCFRPSGSRRILCSEVCPSAKRFRNVSSTIDEELAPQQVANILGGRTVRYLNRNNEWVAIVVIEKVENAAAREMELRGARPRFWGAPF